MTLHWDALAAIDTARLVVAALLLFCAWGLVSWGAEIMGDNRETWVRLTWEQINALIVWSETTKPHGSFMDAIDRLRTAYEGREITRGPLPVPHPDAGIKMLPPSQIEKLLSPETFEECAFQWQKLQTVIDSADLRQMSTQKAIATTIRDTFLALAERLK